MALRGPAACPFDRSTSISVVSSVQAIHQRYIGMAYDTLDKDGNVKTLPVFTDMNVRTQRYTFSHPNGLLFATQFAQIALAEKAAMTCIPRV